MEVPCNALFELLILILARWALYLNPSAVREVEVVHVAVLCVDGIE